MEAANMDIERKPWLNMSMEDNLPNSNETPLSSIPNRRALILGAAGVASVLSVEGVTAERIFGFPDVLKFRSSLTLFSRATGEGEGLFRAALSKYYGGEEDKRTLAMLGRPSPDNL